MRKTSRTGGLRLIGLVIILAGLIYFLDPESVIVNGERGVAKASDGWIFIFVGSTILLLQFGWLVLMNKLNEDKNIPNLLQVKQMKTRGYLYPLWITLPIIIAIPILCAFGPNGTPWAGFIKVMSLYVFFVLSGIWIFHLIKRLFNQQRYKKLNRIVAWGQALSYEQVENASFYFPTKIFDHGINGQVDYLLKKKVSNFNVQIFTYSHTQKSGRNDTTVTYSVVNIETKDELPSFNLIMKTTSSESGLDTMVGETERRLNEEISDASQIDFNTGANKEFCLTVSKKFEIEAIQIFQPEIVDYYAKNWPQIILIGEGKNLIAITTPANTTEEDFKDLDRLAIFLVENIATKISRIGKSVEEMKAVMQKDS